MEKGRRKKDVRRGEKNPNKTNLKRPDVLQNRKQGAGTPRKCGGFEAG